MKTKDPIVINVDARLEKITPKFFARQKQVAIDIRTAFEQRQYKVLAQFGHSMRGTCGGYGFFDLGEMGQVIETAALACDDEKLRHQIAIMEDYLQRIKIQYQDIA